LQIAGGIWADTVGGKTVLGFGVVWWSIATALTPIAAKLGLPFLLVVRAFMGIGEVTLDYSGTYIYSFRIQFQKHLKSME
jgi:MFS family permease